MNNTEQTVINCSVINSLKEKCYQYIATNATKIGSQELLTFNHPDLKEEIWRKIKQKVIYPIKLKVRDFNKTLNSFCLTKNGNIIGNLKFPNPNPDDSSLKIWNFYGKLLQSLNGHTKHITSLCTKESSSYDNNYIVSTSFDQTIKIWDLKKNKCIDTLDNMYQSGYVIGKIISNDNDIIFGDGGTIQHGTTIKIIDFETKEIKQQLSLQKLDNNSFIMSLYCLNNNILIVGNDFRKLTVYDLISGKQITTLPKGFACCSLDNNTIVVGTNNQTIDEKIQLYDTRSYYNSLKEFPVNVCISKICMCDDKICIGSYGNGIKVIDKELTQELMQVIGPQHVIHTMHSFNDEYLLAAANSSSLVRLHINKNISPYEILDLAHQFEKNIAMRNDWWYK